MKHNRADSSWLRLRDVKLLLAIWALAYSFNLYFTWLGGGEISLQTHVLVLTSLATYVVVRVVGEYRRASRARLSRSQRSAAQPIRQRKPRGLDAQAFIFLTGMLLATVAVGARYVGGERSLTLHEIRELHHNTEASSGIFTLLSSAFTVFFYMGWVRFWTNGKSPGFNLALVTLSFLCVFMTTRITGGRSELLILLAISLFCFTCVYTKRFKLRQLLTLAGISLVFLTAHIVYSTARTFKEGDIQSSSRLLNQVEQVPFIPNSSPLYEPLQVAFATTGDYFGINLRALSAYLETTRGEPLWGAYSFPALSSKLGLLSPGERMARKIQVDNETGWNNNVWATCFRELHVDFGYFGCIVAFLLLGVIVNICSRSMSDLSYQILVCVGAFLVLSPFTNALLVRSYELWVVCLVIWWGLDVSRKRLRFNRRSRVSRVLTPTIPARQDRANGLTTSALSGAGAAD